MYHLFSGPGWGSSKAQPLSDATQGQSQLYLGFVELLMPWHTKEGMSAHDPSSWSKMWFPVDDVAGSGSREDKAQK